MKAIDTYYNGNYFRSRLEARWAIFFNELGVAYQYEPVGYISTVGCYLPDFYLPQFSCYVEVKPMELDFYNLNDQILNTDYYHKLSSFVKEGNNDLLLCFGKPNSRPIPILLTVDRFAEECDEYTAPYIIHQPAMSEGVAMLFSHFFNRPEIRMQYDGTINCDFERLLEPAMIANKKRFEYL